MNKSPLRAPDHQRERGEQQQRDGDGVAAAGLAADAGGQDDAHGNDQGTHSTHRDLHPGLRDWGDGYGGAAVKSTDL